MSRCRISEGAAGGKHIDLTFSASIKLTLQYWWWWRRWWWLPQMWLCKVNVCNIQWGIQSTIWSSIHVLLDLSGIQISHHEIAFLFFSFSGVPVEENRIVEATQTAQPVQHDRTERERHKLHWPTIKPQINHLDKFKRHGYSWRNIVLRHAISIPLSWWEYPWK